MTPSNRVKFGLLTLAAMFLAAFAWSAAQGQFRPPVVRPPRFNPPRINPPGIPGGGIPGGGMPGGGGMTSPVWTCPTCNYVYRGAVPPSTCPGCKKQMSNGVGNGIPGPGGTMNPPTMPGFNPPVMNPPIMNPPVMNPPVMNPPVTQAPAFNPPPINNGNAPVLNPVVNPSPVSDPAPANASDSSSSSSSGETKSSKRWVVGLVIGIIVVGVFVLLGGTFLVIYSMRSGDSTPRKSRRRRRDDYDD